MAEKILIQGPSGTGKSFAVATLNPEDTFIICPDKKSLPFRGSRISYKTVFREDGTPAYGKSNYFETNSMADVRVLLSLIATKSTRIKNVVIDTISHAMVASVMRELTNAEWGKYKVFAQELMDLINDIPKYREDLFVFINAHTDYEDMNGVKTLMFKIPAGKFTREVIEPESLFTVVLGSECKQVEGVPTYYFVTQNDGSNRCKSPKDMFPSIRIQNDLKYVRKCIEAYYKGEATPEPKIVAEPPKATSTDF